MYTTPRDNEALLRSQRLTTRLCFCALAGFAFSVYEAFAGHLWSGVFVFCNLFGYRAALDKDPLLLTAYGVTCIWMFFYHFYRAFVTRESLYDQALQCLLYAGTFLCALSLILANLLVDRYP